MRAGSFNHSVRRIVPLAWPVVVGQVAVLAFSTVDTVLVARHSTADLAALAVGAAIYITVFIGLMGVVMAVSPIVGLLHGAQRYGEVGLQLHQSIWLALGLAVIGSSLLAFPGPFLALARVDAEVADKIRGYLLMLAFALPASLLFTVFRGFNTAVARPKAVMAIQLSGLGLKLPLSMLLVSGSPSWGIPALGVTGCGIATLVAMWSQTLAGMLLLRRDPFYQRFELDGMRRLRPPHGPSLRALLRLGLPMGASVLVEVTAFSFMGLFIARLGSTPVAGHQIALNLVSLLFMVPLGLANACSTLVAQSLGADRPADARRLAWHGWHLTLGVAIVLGGLLYLARESVVGLYTRNEAVAAATLPLLAWVALFHAADAVQTLAAFVLRAWHIASVPLVIYAVALWGVGLGGGFVLAFDVFGNSPAGLQGALGFWTAATAGLVLAAGGLSALLIVVTRGLGAAPEQR